MIKVQILDFDCSGAIKHEVNYTSLGPEITPLMDLSL